jgi:cytochrome P450 family 12
MKSIRDENNETPSNFFESLTEWSLESVALIALDKRLGLIDNPENSKLCGMVKKVFEVTFEYDIQPSIWRYFKTPGFYKVLQLYKETHLEIARFIDEAVENYEKNPTPDDQEKGVLEKMLLIDKNIAKTMAEDMLAAGVDTTAATMTSILYCLAKNPVKQEILRKEINSILPEKNSVLSSTSFNNIPYLRAVIKEALRVYPVVNGNIRAAGENLVLQGYQIPKGVREFLNLLKIEII